MGSILAVVEAEGAHLNPDDANQVRIWYFYFSLSGMRNLRPKLNLFMGMWEKRKFLPLVHERGSTISECEKKAGACVDMRQCRVKRKRHCTISKAKTTGPFVDVLTAFNADSLIYKRQHTSNISRRPHVFGFIRQKKDKHCESAKFCG